MAIEEYVQQEALYKRKKRKSTALGTLRPPARRQMAKVEQQAPDMKNNDSETNIDTNHGPGVTRRDFLKYSAWTIVANYTFPSLAFST